MRVSLVMLGLLALNAMVDPRRALRPRLRRHRRIRHPCLGHPLHDHLHSRYLAFSPGRYCSTCAPGAPRPSAGATFAPNVADPARLARVFMGQAACYEASRQFGAGRRGARDPMKDIIEELEKRRAEARLGGGQTRIDAQHNARQADGPRAHRAFDGRELLRGVRHLRRAYLHRLRHGKAEDPGRRRRHRLGYHQRPRRLRLRQGLHRHGRLPVGQPRPQDDQDPGHGAEEPRADHRPVRRRRRPHSGGRRRARRLRRGVHPQRDGFRRHPADLGHHGPVRRRRRLFAGHDRLHLHGEGHELHVRHRPRRGEDGDQRDRHGRGARRRQGPHDKVLDRRRRLRERRRGAAADAPPDGLPAVQQQVGRSLAADRGQRRSRRLLARHAHSRQSRTSRTTSRS